MGKTTSINGRLRDVVMMETAYPCLYYALKRVGKQSLLTVEFMKELHEKLVPYEEGKASIGDILVWMNDSDNFDDGDYEAAPISITKFGTSVWLPHRHDFHVGVFEGGDVVTDCIGNPRGAFVPFVIRTRFLKHTLGVPKYILPYNSLEVL